MRRRVESQGVREGEGEGDCLRRRRWWWWRGAEEEGGEEAAGVAARAAMLAHAALETAKPLERDGGC